jgi:hypothetical protein
VCVFPPRISTRASALFRAVGQPQANCHMYPSVPIKVLVYNVYLEKRIGVRINPNAVESLAVPKALKCPSTAFTTFTFGRTRLRP